ncbi:MAG TPA: alpha-glucosidase, partial [Pseudoalteromonas shioyasakiensis]|nr:alpha-glucosidase [Pseudoalteromonas shioyasakiensis]
MIKPSIYISLLTSSMLAHAQLPLSVTSPDGQITVKLEKQQNQLVYSVNYGNQEFLQQSQLGLNTNLGDFSQSLKYKSHTTASVNESYKLHNAKVSEVNYT